VQRVFVEIVAAPENGFEQLPILLKVPHQQSLGELALVLEMVKEAAFGNAGCRDQLVDRSGRETLGKHGAFRELKQALPCVGALAGNIIEHGGLYHECSCAPRRRAETPRPRVSR
jgi:hypothetical protein